MFDIVEGESICYEYFKEHKITNREDLRNKLKEIPIEGIKKSFIETVFSNYKQEVLTKIHKEKLAKDGYKIICINDLHIPYHDETVLNLVFELIKKEQPHELILNGDIIDCYWESSFIKDPGVKEFLQDECNQFVKLFTRLRKFIKNTKISYILGNHEDRIKRETWKNPSFYRVSSLDIQNLLKFDKLGIELYPVGKIINDFEFSHGKFVSRHSSYSAKLEFEDHGFQSGLSGHTHRMGMHAKTSRKGTNIWYENGCLCSLDPSYIKGTPNWQHGFSIIYQYNNINHVVPILILEKQFIFNGVVYS